MTFVVVRLRTMRCSGVLGTAGTRRQPPRSSTAKPVSCIGQGWRFDANGRDWAVSVKAVSTGKGDGNSV